jgi:hypothetical protein
LKEGQKIMTPRGFSSSRRKVILASAMLAVGGLSAAAAHASTVAVTYTGTGTNSGVNMAASATFTLDTTAHTLSIALTNAIGTVVPSNTYLLTGVFWSSSAPIGGTFTSIGLGGAGTGPGGTGSVVNPVGGDTGYFGYGANTGGPGGRKYGAFSSGYATWDSMLIGPNGTNGETPLSPNGPSGGLFYNSGLTGIAVN